jgi:ribosomal protein S13
MSRFQAQTITTLDEELADLCERLGLRENQRADLLSDTEVERLAEILDRGYSPPPALRKALSRLAESKRRPPRLHWKDAAA